MMRGKSKIPTQGAGFPGSPAMMNKWPTSQILKGCIITEVNRSPYIQLEQCGSEEQYHTLRQMPRREMEAYNWYLSYHQDLELLGYKRLWSHSVFSIPSGTTPEYKTPSFLPLDYSNSFLFPKLSISASPIFQRTL